MTRSSEYSSAVELFKRMGIERGLSAWLLHFSPVARTRGPGYEIVLPLSALVRLITNGYCHSHAKAGFPSTYVGE